MRRFVSVGIVAAVVLLSSQGHAGIRTPLPTRTPKVHAERTPIPTKTVRPTRTLSAETQRTRPATKTALPTRTPLSISERSPHPTKTARPTRTPVEVSGRTPLPTKTIRPTRTPVTIEERTPVERTRPPLKTARPTRTPKVVEERTPIERTRIPTKTARATRTPAEVVGRTPLVTKTPRPTRTPKVVEERTPIERTRIPTKTVRPTRTPIEITNRTPVERTRVPTKTVRPTRTPKVVEERTPIERTRVPTKTARPTRTPVEVGGRTPPPTKTARPTRTPLELSQRSPAPTKTLRPTRTPIEISERSPNPTKTLRPTRTPIVKDHGPGTVRERPPTKTPRPTWTPEPPPQFVRGNINSKCIVQQKGQRTTIFLRVDNESGAEITNVHANEMRIQAEPGTQFTLDSGPSPRSVARLRNGDTATFMWRGEFVPPGAVALIGSASGTDPFGAPFNTALLDCGSIAWQNDNGGSEADDPVITGDPPLPPSVGGTPDLTIDAGALASSMRIETGNFGPDNCAIAEACVGGTGLRRLLRFDTKTPNIGTGDLFLGDPRQNSGMVWSQCHRHYHFSQYADYRLLSTGGQVVATGHKQAFCLIDLDLVNPGLGVDGPKYTCDYQGITKGWADIYDSFLDCQWIDITGVPDGNYMLEVRINPAQVIHELDYGNNAARVAVHIGN